MNNLIPFVFGFLAGWLVEWIIDWIYWRKKLTIFQSERDLLIKRVKDQEIVCSEHTQALDNLRSDNLSLQTRTAELEAENDAMKKANSEIPFETGAMNVPIDTKSVAVEPNISPLPVQTPVQPDISPLPVQTPVQPDDLIIIRGIGPVINRKLNQAGILTFRQLSEITPARLREIVGDVIQRLSNEDSIIEQARQLADKKDRGV